VGGEEEGEVGEGGKGGEGVDGGEGGGAPLGEEQRGLGWPERWRGPPGCGRGRVRGREAPGPTGQGRAGGPGGPAGHTCTPQGL